MMVITPKAAPSSNTFRPSKQATNLLRPGISGHVVILWEFAPEAHHAHSRPPSKPRNQPAAACYYFQAKRRCFLGSTIRGTDLPPADVRSPFLLIGSKSRVPT